MKVYVVIQNISYKFENYESVDSVFLDEKNAKKYAKWKTNNENNFGYDDTKYYVKEIQIADFEEKKENEEVQTQ